jgi:hypothetical protein
MGVRRARSNTSNEHPHAPVLALLRTSDLVMGSCVGPLNDVHGPLDHERHALSSLQGGRALILGQPPRSHARDGLPGVDRLQGHGGHHVHHRGLRLLCKGMNPLRRPTSPQA